MVWVAVAFPSKDNVVDYALRIPFKRGKKAPSTESNRGEVATMQLESKGAEEKRADFQDSWKIELTKAEFVSIILATFVVGWYLATKHWLGNNLIGIAFSIQGIKSLSVGSYKTWVAFSFRYCSSTIFFLYLVPLIMVSVAKNGTHLLSSCFRKRLPCKMRKRSFRC